MKKIGTKEKILTTNASAIARAKCGNLNGSEEAQKFGKYVEETIQKALWEMSKNFELYNFLWESSVFVDESEVENEDEIVRCSVCDGVIDIDECGYVEESGRWYDSICFDCMRKRKLEEWNIEDDRVYEMLVYFARYFQFQKIKTPKTIFREWNGRRIYAKADLEGERDIVEFKIYGKNQYAIAQAEVMSWVYQKPITLIFFDFSAGKMKVEKMEIDTREKIEIPENTEWTEQEVDYDE